MPSKKLERRYDRLYKRWHKKHQQYWEKMASKPYISGLVQNEMTVGQRSLLEPEPYRAYGNIQGSRRVKGSDFKSDAQIKTAIEQMERQLAPGYERRRAKAIKANFTRAAKSIGNDELTYRIANLSNEQLRMLADQGDFGNTIWRLAYPPDNIQFEDDVDLEFLDYNLDYIEEQYPSRTRKKKRSKVKDLFAKWDILHNDIHRRNIELARQGEKTLRSYGTAPTIGQGADWWRQYERYFPRK